MDELIDYFEAHCKSRFLREFGAKLRGDKSGKGKFTRNNIAESAEELFNLAKFFNFRDCYASLYSFTKYDESTWDRDSAIIDTLLFDLDHKANLSIAFKEAKKLVSHLLDRNVMPRVYFSGKKGFHVYIDFPTISLANPKEVIKRMGVQIANRLKLTTIDFQVFEVARLIRLPFTIHGETGYRCTPIDPEKFLRLDPSSIIHYCKYNHAEIEVHESRKFAKLLKYEDFKLSTNRVVREILKPRLRVEKRNGKGWREKRIRLYTETLREYGRLSANPEIIKIHLKSPHVNPDNAGSIEHQARVHFVLLLIEAGYSDEEIHGIFRLAEDYNPKIVQEKIDYNRRWLKRKKEVEACS